MDISSGQLNRLLVEGYDDFHAEKEELLSPGLEISSSIQGDDTGARHQSHNGVCTHIGNACVPGLKVQNRKVGLIS